MCFLDCAARSKPLQPYHSTSLLPQMIYRYVRLRFNETSEDDFRKIFSESQPKIAAFPGCRGVELWKGGPGEFATFSEWDSEVDLENYRHSDLFNATWAKVKIMFNDRPFAQSYRESGFNENK